MPKDQWRPRWTYFTAATSRALSLQQIQSLSQVLFASYRVQSFRLTKVASKVLSLQSAELMNCQELLLQSGARVGFGATQKTVCSSFGVGNVEIPMPSSLSKVRFHYKWLASLHCIFIPLCFALHHLANVEGRQHERT